MKPLLTFITTLFIIINMSLAQSPAGFNYQAIVRDADGNIRADQGISLSFEIQLPTGSAVYRETHTAITNKFGLANGVKGCNKRNSEFSLPFNCAVI